MQIYKACIYKVCDLQLGTEIYGPMVNFLFRIRPIPDF
jgi:hypothetical protein